MLIYFFSLAIVILVNLLQSFVYLKLFQDEMLKII